MTGLAVALLVVAGLAAYTVGSLAAPRGLLSFQPAAPDGAGPGGGRHAASPWRRGRSVASRPTPQPPGRDATQAAVDALLHGTGEWCGTGPLHIHSGATPAGTPAHLGSAELPVARASGGAS